MPRFPLHHHLASLLTRLPEREHVDVAITFRTVQWQRVINGTKQRIHKQAHMCPLDFDKCVGKQFDGRKPFQQHVRGLGHPQAATKPNQAPGNHFNSILTLHTNINWK